MSTVTLFSLQIILLKSLKNLISLLFSIVFHHPYVYSDNGTPIFLLRLYPHFPPSFQLYCPWPVSGDRNIEADIYCGVGNKGKEAAAAGRNILSDWLNAFLFLLYVHFSLCSSALQFGCYQCMVSFFCLVNYASLLPRIMFCLITFMNICTHVSILVVWLRILCVLTVYVVVSCHSKSIGIQRGSLSLCCSHLCSLGDTV